MPRYPLNEAKMRNLPEDIKNSVRLLIFNTYRMPPKVFEKEELAVKQTLQLLLEKMKDPPKQRSLIPAISTEALENMTKRAQLTIVAEHLTGSFLKSIEDVIKNSPLVFTHFHEKQALSDLYKKCQSELLQQLKSPPLFRDVLLRMYTKESAFYKKINAILGGYNDPTTTTLEERQMALLLNVAIHKAGLEKRRQELQETPFEIFRGQSFGYDTVIKKFERVKQLQADGDLTAIDPVELAQISIADIASKKIVSTTDEKNVAINFAAQSETGLVLRIQNPEELADFYNIANVSAIASESEFISRIPDDIAMIPTHIYQDPHHENVYHVDVMCIRSSMVLINNSERLHEIRDSLNLLVNKALTDNKKGPYHELFTDLRDTIKLYVLSNDTTFQQNGMLAYKKLMKLYESNPTKKQKMKLDEIKSKLSEYIAISLDLKVLHETHDLFEHIATTRAALNDNLVSKDMWVDKLNTNPEKRHLIMPIKAEIDRLLDKTTTDETRHNAAANIILALKTNDKLMSSLPGLKEELEQIITLLDTIKHYETALKNSTHTTFTETPAPTANPATHYKEKLDVLKNPDVFTEATLKIK